MPRSWDKRGVKVADVGPRIQCKDEREIFEKLGAYACVFAHEEKRRLALISGILG